MRRVFPLLCLVGICTTACGLFATQTIQTGHVYMAEGGTFGKAVFIVSPVNTDPDCQIEVDSQDGKRLLDCNSEYVIGCDVSIPGTQPFCQLVTEIGPERDSSYPKTRR